MTKVLSVNNLNYEELVLLQEIVLKVSMNGTFEEDPQDREVFESLYEKVMQSWIMLTVRLTHDQFYLLQDLVSDKFNEVAQAWLPAEETKEMNELCYKTLLNMRAVRAASFYDSQISEPGNPFLISKSDYIKENYLVTDEELDQQGISWPWSGVY